MLTIVEKVMLLQEVDIFKFTTTEDLAHIAAITEEVELADNQVLFNEGDIPDAMYMVIDGGVRLSRNTQEIMIAKSKDVFGTWALFDDEPQVAAAATLQESKLLRIDREDFIDLLADHVQITQGILKALVKKMRSLVGRVGL